jgi:hypothetical protein
MVATTFGTNIDLRGHQLINVVVEVRTTDPTGAGLTRGRIWFNDTDHVLRYYDGTDVQTVGEDFTLPPNLNAATLNEQLPAFYLNTDNHQDGAVNRVFTAVMADFLASLLIDYGTVDPEDAVTHVPGWTYVNTDTGTIWQKTANTDATGWQQVVTQDTLDTAVAVVATNLSNLTDTVNALPDPVKGDDGAPGVGHLFMVMPDPDVEIAEGQVSEEFVSPVDLNITSFILRLPVGSTAPGTIVGDLQADTGSGFTSLYSDTAHRPGIPAGAQLGSPAPTDVQLLPAGKPLRFELITVPAGGSLGVDGASVINSGATNITSYSIPIPAACQAGDLLVHAQAGSSTTVDPPDGWTEYVVSGTFPVGDSTGPQWLHILTRVAEGDQTYENALDRTVSISTGPSAMGTVALAGAVADTAAWAAAHSLTAATSIPLPTVTTTEDGEIVLYMAAERLASGGAEGTPAFSGGVTDDGGSVSTRSAQVNFGLHFGHEVVVTAGATTAHTFGTLGSAARYMAASLVFKQGATSQPTDLRGTVSFQAVS